MNDMKFWYVGIANKQEGPLSVAEVVAMLSNGKLTPESLVWKDGMADWQPIVQVPALYNVWLNRPTTMAGKAKTALVCGVLSWLCTPLGIIMCVPAIVMGRKVLKSKVANDKERRLAKWGFGLGVCFGTIALLVCGFVVGLVLVSKTKMGDIEKRISEANTIYDTGRKAEAVSIYEKCADSAWASGSGLDETVFNRMIDYAAEVKDDTKLDTYLQLALKWNVTPHPESEAGQLGIARLVKAQDAKCAAQAYEAGKKAVEGYWLAWGDKVWYEDAAVARTTARNRIHLFHKEYQPYFQQGWDAEDALQSRKWEANQDADRAKTKEKDNAEKRAKGWMDVDE